MNRPAISVLTPVYNRADRIAASLRSGLEFCNAIGGAEIVVVDDASTDRTVDVVREGFSAAIEAGRIALIRLPANVGVTGARNAGAEAARGDWLVFLDSDDTLSPDAAGHIAAGIASAGPQTPFLFFRTRNAQGELIGERRHGSEPVTIAELYNHRFGECLPVVRRTAWSAEPFDARLRGYEGLTYARMVKRFGPGLAIHQVARVYDTSGADRLSAPAQLRRRACQMAAGHFAFAKTTWRELGVFDTAATLAKALAYAAICIVRGRRA